MSKGFCGLLILCATALGLQLGCQQANQPVPPSSPAKPTPAAVQSTPVESVGAAPAEPATATMPIPLTDLMESNVSAFIFSKNDEWKVIVDGKPSPHGLFMHPHDNGNASVTFPIQGKFHQFTASAAINDTVLSNMGTATPLVFVVQGNGKELWRSRPAQKCAELQPLTVDITGINELTLVVECKGSFGFAHAVWVEPMLYQK